MNIEYIMLNTGSSMTNTERDSVINSISTIAGTPYATAPFMRSMGIKHYPPESSSEISRNQYAAEVVTQCSRWEGRAEVSEVLFEGDNNVRVVVKSG